MTTAWTDGEEPAPVPISPGGWLRVAWRGGLLGAVVFGGLALLLLVRLFEHPLCGQRRPVTPWIAQAVCRAAFVILRMPHRIRGAPMQGRGAVVANHVSWLDILALNARKRVYFVSKAEVAGWPGIGWLARSTGTLFITRDRRAARAQQELFEFRLLAGHKLLFFPEGTSTDGMRILPFKSTLFEAFFNDHLRSVLQVQPVTLVYRAPAGADPRFYGWWGGMSFGAHLLKVLAAAPQGSVEVICHPSLKVADFTGRKALAEACEAAVRSAMPGAGRET